MLANSNNKSLETDRKECCSLLLNQELPPLPLVFPFFKDGFIYDFKESSHQPILNDCQVLKEYDLSNSITVVVESSGDFPSKLTTKTVKVKMCLNFDEISEQEDDQGLVEIYKFLIKLQHFGMSGIPTSSPSDILHPNSSDDFLSLFRHLSSGKSLIDFPFDRVYIKPIYKSQLASLIRSKNLDSIEEVDQVLLDGGVDLLSTILGTNPDLKSISKSLPILLFPKLVKSVIPLSFGTSNTLVSALERYYEQNEYDSEFEMTLTLKKFDTETFQTLLLLKTLTPYKTIAKTGARACLTKRYGKLEFMDRFRIRSGRYILLSLPNPSKINSQVILLK